MSRPRKKPKHIAPRRGKQPRKPTPPPRTGSPVPAKPKIPPDKVGAGVEKEAG